MSSHVFKKLYNFSVYTIGICVLLAATIATLVRILLPDIGMYRSEVEAWVSNYMELPVVIHSINAEWNGWTPHLYLEQIDLMDSAGTEPIIYFEKANISINMFSSLIRRQIIPEQLVISGLDISVMRLKDGSIDIEGIKVGNYQAQDKADDELGNWFINQNRIIIQQANIEWQDFKHDQPPLRLSNVGLILTSDGERLQLEGSSSLPAGYGSNMNFAIDVTGNLLTSDWSADVYMQANNIVPENWYKQHWPDKLMLSGGNASISLWSTLTSTKINSFRGLIHYNDLELYTEDKHILDIQNLRAGFGGVQQNEGNWLFDIHINELQTQNSVWPETDLSLRAENLNSPDKINLDLNFSYVNLNDLQRFVVILPNISSSVSKYTDSHEIFGELIDGNISYIADAAADEQFLFNFSFKGLNSDLISIEPRVSDLSGQMSGSTKNGEIRFSDDYALVQHFKGNDAVTLNGKLLWDKTADKTTISSNNLRIANEHINTLVSGTMVNSGDDSFIDAILEVSGDDIQNVIKYMPYSSKFRARDWIARSVPTGTLKKYKLLFRGNPKNFPFDNKDGQFVSTARIDNAVLEYSQKFPMIENINADLSFHGRELQIDVEHGNIFNSNLTNAKAFIPNLFVLKKDLSIEGKINGQTKDLKLFLTNSPLNNDLLLAKINDSLASSGNMQLNLDLLIPLKNPDKRIAVNGHLVLENSGIVSTTNKLQLTDLNGDINFTETSVVANTMAAKLDGIPVALSINGSKDSTDNPARIIISGTGNQEFIASQVDSYFPALTNMSDTIRHNLSGIVNWEAAISYRKDSAKTGLSRSLEIRSDLNGMAIDLPVPLAKKDYENIILELKKDLDPKTEEIISLRYGDINSEIIFEQKKLNRVNIRLGDTDLELADKPGINIAGNFQHINVSEWIDLMPENMNSTVSSGKRKVNANILINSLEYLGLTFTDTSIKADNINDEWHISVASPDIQGDISFANLGAGDKHVIANLESLNIRKSSTVNNGITNPASLPSMLVKINSFKYNDMDLGTLKLTAVPTNNGLLIEDISFNKQNMKIQANGKWNNNRYTGSTSNFFINVYANEFNQLLDTFGFNNDSIAKSETKLTIDANWPGTPFNFDLAKLNGTIKLDMKKGALLDFQPAAGRLFGLLSLQTLPRRMVLDFSDLFGTGMAFDSIKGSFSVNDGNAYTDNLAMKGPSVNIDIRGRAGLSDKDYDQLAIITPQISDSLAVASGFLGPIGIGLGSVLYLASNMFEPLSDSINKIMKIEYYIKGSWDDPVVERAGEKTDS